MIILQCTVCQVSLLSYVATCTYIRYAYVRIRSYASLAHAQIYLAQINHRRHVSIIVSRLVLASAFQ